MFYIKVKSENLSAKFEIEPDNVFTKCAGCGDEIHVNLETLLRCGETDLLSTIVFCDRCSGTMQKCGNGGNRCIALTPEKLPF